MGATPNAEKVMGVAQAGPITEQLLREQKRQARSAGNAIPQTEGFSDDGPIVGVLDGGSDLEGYLPPVTEEG